MTITIACTRCEKVLGTSGIGETADLSWIGVTDAHEAGFSSRPLDHRLAWEPILDDTPYRRAPGWPTAWLVAPTGSDGGRTLRRGPGEPSAKTTAPRRRLDVLPARTCPQPGLSLERGRHRRLLQPVSEPLHGPRPLERARSHPQGAILRPRGTRGQPWRGRQGILLLPRCHANSLLHEDALQVSSGRVSLRAARRGVAKAEPARAEFELFDAIGDAFRAGRYFDVFIEYARADQEDILCRITAVNRGP